MSSRFKYSAFASAAVLIVIILCIVYFSFNSKANSPEYAMQMIEEAISQMEKAIKLFKSYHEIEPMMFNNKMEEVAKQRIALWKSIVSNN